MEIQTDDMTGKVYHEHIEVLGWTYMKGSKRIYAIKCSTCANDPELFLDGVFETSKESLNRGYKPCGCGRSYRFSEEQYRILLTRKAKELGVEFVGFKEEFKGGKTQCIIRCKEGDCHPKAFNFLYKGHIKFNRGKTTVDDSIIIQKFFSTGVFHKDTIFSRYRLYNKWYWKVDCPVCNESGVSQSQHLQKGCRPCRCGNYKQKFSYIHGIYDKDTLIAIKFGISQSRDLRIKYQSRETLYDIKCLGVWEYPEKHSCVSAERVCQSELDCGIPSRMEFGDGYTETTYPTNIDKIIKTYENYGGIRVDAADASV